MSLLRYLLRNPGLIRSMSSESSRPSLERLWAEKLGTEKARVDRIEELVREIERTEKSNADSTRVRMDAAAAKSMLKYAQTQLGIEVEVKAADDEDDEDEVQSLTQRILSFQIDSTSDEQMEQWPRP